MSKKYDETKVTLTYRGKSVETTGKTMRLLAEKLKRENTLRFKHSKGRVK